MADRKSKGGGYCRPPKEHQFKPGQSGNLKGRPRKIKPSLNEALLRDMEKHHEVAVDNFIITMPATIRLAAKNLVAVAASPSMTTPRANAPSAPIPVHTV